MPVSWLPHSHLNEWIPVLQMCVDVKYLVRLCADQSYWRTTRLHWDNTLRKTVPCLGHECPSCPQPTRIVTYCPAIMLMPAAKQWLRRIVPITDYNLAMLEKDLERSIFELLRKGRATSPWRWRIVEELVDPPPLQPFIIDASLLKMWGCQCRVEHAIRSE